MTVEEVLDYFDAVNYFDRNYNKRKTEDIIIQMYGEWPKQTMQLMAQGFFVAILQEN